MILNRNSLNTYDSKYLDILSKKWERKVYLSNQNWIIYWICIWKRYRKLRNGLCGAKDGILWDWRDCHDSRGRGLCIKTGVQPLTKISASIVPEAHNPQEAGRLFPSERGINLRPLTHADGRNQRRRANASWSEGCLRPWALGVSFVERLDRRGLFSSRSSELRSKPTCPHWIPHRFCKCCSGTGRSHTSGGSVKRSILTRA